MVSQIQENIAKIRAELPEGVELVAVSKFFPKEDIADAYEGGQRVFGESRAQEVVLKAEELPKDIKWHFIGHLQQNKVKTIAPFVSLIQAVDSFKLLREIDKEAKKNGRIIPCLLEIHVAQEETKFGFSPEECRQMLEKEDWQSLSNTRIDGIMCMASNVDDTVQIGKEFHRAYNLFEELKNDFFKEIPTFAIRSWGMSHDYKIAIKEGCTMVRVGSKIFGSRNYS